MFPQKLVSEGQYGPGMAELEQQVAEHNILQREIEAYGQQLRTLVGPVSESLSSLGAGLPFFHHGPGWVCRPSRERC